MVAVHHLSANTHSPPAGPPVIFCHATGFHGRVWQPVADALSARFDCWAIDFRGHGDTRVPDGGSVEWTRFAEDLLAATRHIGVGPMCAVGHSMGGAAIVLCELANPGTFSRAYLFEPILYPSMPPDMTRKNRFSDGARRRTEFFDSIDQARARYASRPPLNSFDPRSLDAYVEHGFEHVEGGVKLKCRGELEARVFDHSQNGAFERLSEVRTHIVVAAGGEPEGPATFASAAVAKLVSAELQIDETLSHFAPMEHPDLIASRIEHHLLADTSGR